MANIDFARKLYEYKNKSEEEILQFLSDFWGIKPDSNGVFTLVAKYQKARTRDKNGNEFARFVDVRNSVGDILYYPFRLGLVSIWTNCNPKFEKQDYWQISVKLADKKYREKNPFSLIMANTIVGLPSVKYKDKLEKEKLIKKIFEETGSTERDAKNISSALHTIMGDLYTETERFVFELLQNADDQPEKGIMVDVKLKTLNENLLFLHSGKPFSSKDVESISSIGDSTKKNDSEKTGYKGIGFKSVFSDAETVFINSGNFSFAFDKHSPVYPADANMDEIPWQIKPIWEERYRLPKEVQNEKRFFSSPVAIALHVGTDNIQNYNRIIPKLMLNPRFVLFLRNIGNIIFEDSNDNSIEIQKTFSSNTIQIHSNGVTENWTVKDYVIPIPQETSDEIQNEKLIPAKLKKATLTKITFAAKIDDDKILPVDNSVLYTYLPTKVNDFNFPFLINADFLTTASRESIHLKNIWNKFLFSQIGKLLVDWVETLNEYEGALCVLPTKGFGENNILGYDFQNTYKDALNKRSFIKGHKGDILPQNEIILDKTGLSNIIGKDLFCEILHTKKQLPYRDIDSTILDNDLFGEVGRITLGDIKERLAEHAGIYSWYIAVNEEVKSKFNKWVINNKCEEIIVSLPLFHYPEGWKSVRDIKNDVNCVLLSEKHSHIENILHKLGFKYPDTYIESNFFIDYIKESNEEYLFDEIVKRAEQITLSPEEKLKIVTTKFDGVGEKKIAQVNLFCNELGVSKALENMVSYRENAPIWLKPYMIRKEESLLIISKFLIQDKEIYTSIIEKDIDKIIKQISLKDLYIQYKDSWTLLFTKKIIKSYGVTEDTLSFVEVQGPEIKSFFLQEIPKIKIDINVKYKKEDFICRILRLAFDVFSSEQIRSFASKLYVGERNVTSFTVSDVITFEYHEGKKIHMKLSQLLPDFNDSNMVQRIKECFSIFESSELERLLSLVPMDTKDIWQKMDKSRFTPAQYLLGIYQTRKVNRYYAEDVPNIDLSKTDENWIKSLLDILYEQKIELFDDSFGYRLSPYFKGYFSNKYVNDDEIILPAIEKWADNDEKRSYIVSLGVKTERAKLIQLRKSIINNEIISTADIEAQKDYIGSTIELFVSKGLLPFTGENQIKAMLMFEEYNRYVVTSQCDIGLLKSFSSEYNLPEYLSWKTDDKISICLYKQEMPKKLVYTSKNNLLVCKYDAGDYYYEPLTKVLYINDQCKVRDVLYFVISDKQVPFEASDWQKLYYDNLVSKAEVENKDKEIQHLKDELERYRRRFGSLQENRDDGNDGSASEMNYEEKSDTEVKEHGKDTDKDAIDENARKSINHDARVAAKEYLECSSDYDCTAWNPKESSHLVYGLVKYKGKPITIAITSSKSRKLYLHPRVVAEVMGNPQNLLLNYGVDNRIHSLSFDDVFKNNPNVNLVFDTDFVSPKHIAELANKYMASKRTCFVIENPRYSSSDTIQSFGLNEKKEDGMVNVDISEEDLFNW